MTNNDKANLEALLEDYATKPIPADISVGGFRIAMINTALAFSLPALLTGVQVGSSVGFEQSVQAFLWGGLIVAIIGSIAGLVGIRNRISTYMILRFSFGSEGSKLINFLVAASLFGWFGVNVYLFGQAASELWLSITGMEIARWIFVLFGGVVMTAGAIFGFKSIQKLAIFVVPVQILILTFLLNKVFGNASIQELLGIPAQDEISLGESISIVVGCFIVAAVIMPDFTRYGRTWRDSVIASFTPYLIATTFTYIITAAAAIWTGQSDILALMVTVGLGVFAFILVIFSSWITNSINLYGCSLSMAAVFPRFKEWRIVVASGMAGTLIAFFGILEHFIDFIFSLGIIFTPIAAIYVTDFFVIHKGYYSLEELEQNTGISIIAITAWLLGISAAYGASQDWYQLTHIPSCDSLLVSGLTYLLLKKLHSVLQDKTSQSKL